MLSFLKLISKRTIMAFVYLTMIFSIYQGVEGDAQVSADSILQQEYNPHTDPAIAPHADISELSEMDPALPSYPQKMQGSSVANWLPYHVDFDSLVLRQPSKPPAVF
jgi:hypothetical protein